MIKNNLQLSAHRMCSVFLFLTIFSCGKNASELSEKETTAITEKIKETLNNYYAEIKKDGLTAEFKYLDHSSGFYWTPPGSANPITYEDVEKSVAQLAGRYSSIDNKWISLRVDPLTSELASYNGRIESTSIDTSGNSSFYNLVETGLMIKRTDGWKLFRGQTSVVQ